MPKSSHAAAHAILIPIFYICLNISDLIEGKMILLLRSSVGCMLYILSTKRNAMFYLQFLGLKIIDLKIVLIQWFCLPIKTLIA